MLYSYYVYVKIYWQPVFFSFFLHYKTREAKKKTFAKIHLKHEKKEVLQIFKYQKIKNEIWKITEKKTKKSEKQQVENF